MLEAPIPENEAERIASLDRMNILDTHAEERLDRITRIATSYFKAPISTLSIVDSNREWFKSCQGVDMSEGPRAISFCGHAMLEEDLLVIPDTQKDPRFADNPMVTGKPYIRFYAGQAIANAEGHKIGTFCIKDTKPRDFSEVETRTLRDLAAWAELELNMHDLSLALTERRKAEEALQESEQHIRSIIETANDAYIEIDENSVITNWNQEAEKMFGWSKKEAIGKKITETIMPPQHREAHIKGMQHFIKSGEGAFIHKTIEITALHRDRSEFPIELTIWPTKLKRKVSFNAFLRDISKRKRIEKMFEGLVEASPDALVMIGEEGKIILINAQTEKIFGYRREELLGKSIENLMPERFRGIHFHHRHNYSLEPKVRPMGANLNLVALHKDGHEFPVEISLGPVKSEGKNFVVSSIRDITERRKYEEEINILAKFPDQNPNPVLQVRKDGLIPYANEASTDLLMRLGIEVGQYVPDDLRRHVEGVLKSNSSKNFEFSIQHRVFAFLAVPLVEIDLAYFYGVDITETDRMENELRLAYKDLSVKEKTLRMTYRELEHAHEELKQTQSQLLQSEKLAAIGQLAAGIAHEINNPTGYIGSNLQTLGEYMQSYARVLSMVEQLKRPIKNKDVEQANAILTEMTALEQEIGLGFIRDDIDNLVKESQNGVERIKEIVMNLRTFSREEEGELVDINVERVIESILKIVWNEIKYKAELKKDFGGLPPVKCNANRLGQVLINVIVNAAQAIEDQGFIEIKTYQRDKYAYIEISDTGKGIDEETQKRIFDPFFTTKPAGQGIGLGLSICHDIMKKQGGELTVQSEVGKGTTFCIMLPL